METITVSNGTTQIVVVPQSEFDQSIITHLLKDGPLEVLPTADNLSILGINVRCGLIIRQKQKEVANANG